MTNPGATAQLDTLTDKGLIELATKYPELEYLFRHWLVQDAAYGSLLKQERRELHGRVGEALEELYPDRREELAPVLAMHFEQAGETDKAIDYLLNAGRHGAQRNAIKESYAAFDRAAELIEQSSATAPATGKSGQDADLARRRVEAEVGRAQSGYSFLDPEVVFGALEAAVPEADA